MENIYKKKLLNNITKLDALLDTEARLTGLCNKIINTQDAAALKALLMSFSKIKSSDKSADIKQLAEETKQELVLYLGWENINSKISNLNNNLDDNRSLEDLLDELNRLIGLSEVKEKVLDLITYQRVQKLRNDAGLINPKSTMHLAFTGNPGTGKTTVARIVGRVYKKIGLLSKGHFIEVSRTDLIAGYQGQTALKVKNVIEQAKGGVLFIDEAYSLTENDHSDSYGRECLTELTKALEDYRDDLVVIVAGYTKPMEKFFESNPGLKSRFNTFIEFTDYNSQELLEIFEKQCKDNNYYLTETGKQLLFEFFDKSVRNKDVDFPNGRLSRNIFDDLTMIQAKRVINIKSPTRDELSSIDENDVISYLNRK